MFFDSELWKFTRGVRLRIAYAVLIGVLASAIGIGRLALLGWLLGEVFTGTEFSELVLPFALVGVVMLARGGLEYWRNIVAHETAARVQVHLRGALFDKVVQLGPAYFGLERTGDVLTSLVDGVEQLETYFGQYLPQVVVAALIPLLVCLAVSFLDWPVAVTLLGFALFTLFAPSVFSKWDSENSRRRQQAYGQFAAEFLDTLQGLGTLKAFGQSTNRGRLLAARAHELFRSTMWVLATNALGRGITDTGLAVGAACALALGAYLVQAGEMSLLTLLIILMMGIEEFRPQRDLRAYLHQGMVGQAAAKGILSLLAARPVVEASQSASLVSGMLEPTIEFEDVSFTYPSARRPSHRGLSFQVHAGERVGIVGTSGAGKTSILRLLLRLYDPQGGSVRIGGHNLVALNSEDIYRHIAVVNQDTYLFYGTVEENLRFGRQDASQSELERAARAANAHAFITELPQGYDTVVGERGLRLSGGQRQRIAIARALLRDAPILILDEALSAVDAENEAVIQEALDRLMEGRTTLIFAHRLSSVIGADRLLVLDQGQVVETGTHQALMARKGTYFQLMRGQAEETRDADEVDLREGRGRRLAEQVSQGREVSTEPLLEPTDGILRAEGMGWLDAFIALLSHIRPWKAKLTLTFLFGILRVVSLIGVGVLSALAVAAVKQEQPFESYLLALAFAAPAAGVLHWLESWFAHDMAFRMLAEMRIDG